MIIRQTHSAHAKDNMQCMALLQRSIYIAVDVRWSLQDFRTLNMRTKRFLEYLKAFLYPTVLEISVFGVKLPDISSVR